MSDNYRAQIRQFMVQARKQLKLVIAELKESFPIQWSNFKKFDVLFISFVEAGTYIKAIIIILSLGTLLSTYFLGYGIFLALTKEVAAQGGEIREGVINAEIRYLNPVLEQNSEAERKINTLLYLPLYTVTYPDYSSINDGNVPQPFITPILLSEEPSWVDSEDKNIENRYQRLRFTLRDDIYWSDNTKITYRDIEYTFDRLKEEKGNSQFRELLNSVTLEPVSGNKSQFDLVSKVSNYQLLYTANFSPISRDFFENITTDRLTTDSRSFRPTKTSGYFVFEDKLVLDPDAPGSSQKRENPIRDQKTNAIQTIILNRNTVQNTSYTTYPDTYIIRNFNTLVDTPGTNTESLAKAAKAGNVDLVTRTLAPNSKILPQEIKSTTSLQQQVIGTNTYYTLFLNIRVNDLFINQGLRKYVICSFANMNVNDDLSDLVDNLPRQKRILPLQLGLEQDPDCPADPATTLDNRVYKIENDQKSGFKRVLLFGQPFSITLVGVEESEPLLSRVQRFFLDIGIPADVIKNPADVNQALRNKTYNAAFLPITLASADPYTLYGASGQNFSEISKNNRGARDLETEANLKAYSLSGLSDSAARDKLVTFFAQEYSSLSLFKGKSEVNFSNRIKGIAENIPPFITFPEQFYSNSPLWAQKTRREWK